MIRLLGKIDCLVARIVYGKATEDQTIEKAACEFIVGLNAELAKDGQASVENPWAPAPEDQGEKPAVDYSTDSVDVVQYDKDGNVVNSDFRSVIEKGVKPGVRLQRKEEDDRTTTVEVKSVGRDGSIVGVAVAEDGSSTRTSVIWQAADVLKARVTTWRAEFLDNWMTSLSPSANDAYQTSLCKSSVVLAVDAVAVATDAPRLKVQTKPSKKLLADADYPRHSLVLVCQSLKASVVQTGGKLPKNAVVVKLPEKFKSNFVAFLTPSNTELFFCPVWHARLAASGEEATFALTYVDSQTDPAVGVPAFWNEVDVKCGAEIVLPNFEKLQAQAILEQATDDKAENDDEGRPADEEGPAPKKRARGEGKGKAAAKPTRRRLTT